MSLIEKKYNSDLLKGTGMVQETLRLLMLYKPEMSKEQMTKQVTESNILVKASNMRIKDIVEIIFYKRYVNESPITPIYLQTLINKVSKLDVTVQLLLIYTARSNKILNDFILQVYWPEAKKTAKELDSSTAMKFIDNTIRHSDLITNWSDTTKQRVARHLIATLVDFRFLNKDKTVKPIFLLDITANYLAHELHFKGLSDNALIEANDWKLFGYSRFETIKHLERLSFQGHFIFQNSGEIVKINWSYKNMQEFTHAIR
jgi:hypothetical protein